MHPGSREIGSDECTETFGGVKRRTGERGERSFSPIFASPVSCYPEGTSCKLSGTRYGRGVASDAKAVETKRKRSVTRSADRYLPNVTLRYVTLRYVTNVTGNSAPSRFPNKVRSLRGSERALLPLSRNAGRRRGIVKSRVCELSTFDSSDAREKRRDLRPRVEREREKRERFLYCQIFAPRIPTFHRGGEILTTGAR